MLLVGFDDRSYVKRIYTQLRAYGSLLVSVLDAMTVTMTINIPSGFETDTEGSWVNQKMLGNVSTKHPWHGDLARPYLSIPAELPKLS